MSLEDDGYESDFIGPDGESVGDVVMNLFQQETGITVAWREEPVNPASMTAQMAEMMRKIPGMEDKVPEMKTVDMADVTIPVSLLINLAKLATIGAAAAAEIGLDVPLKALEVGEDGEQRPGGVEGMVMAYYDDRDDAEKGITMGIMTAGFFAKEGVEHKKAQNKAKMEKELENLEVPDCLPEGFGESK